MKAIATVTLNPSIDVATDVDRVLPTHKLRCGPPRRDPGGGGINVARVIQELGGTAVAVYTSGGTLGKFLQDLLRREGIEDRPIDIACSTRESFTVNETSSGKQFRFVLPGPEVDEKEWRQCLKVLEFLTPFPDYFVASGSLPPGIPNDFYARLARIARRGDARVILDTSGEALGPALEEGVFLIKPNLRELADLTGESVKSNAEQEDACRSIVEGGGAEMVALTLGNQGAVLVTKDLTRRVLSPEVKIRSPVGAGDSFLGGMALALARNEPAEKAFFLGVAAGTAAVITPGTELCRKEDTDRILAELLATNPLAGS